ncbi:unnamed protein product [Lactuca saligna]|uniref:Uncharacterized protein n=1 Tax=Lactuca saligna TaxID=75948 RepID=A0AA36EGV3_LACSI|nr:unnamed protein product [Lactuca saligna]
MGGDKTKARAKGKGKATSSNSLIGTERVAKENVSDSTLEERFSDTRGRSRTNSRARRTHRTLKWHALTCIGTKRVRFRLPEFDIKLTDFFFKR